MEGIYKFHWDVGRMGDVDGVFIADTEQVKNAIGKNVYFGEILGKHSEVYGELGKKDFTLVTKEQSVIDMFNKFGLSSGYNPLDYLGTEDEEPSTLPEAESYYMYSAGDECRQCDGIYKEVTLMDSIHGRYTCDKCKDVVFAGTKYE